MTDATTSPEYRDAADALPGLARRLSISELRLADDLPAYTLTLPRLPECARDARQMVSSALGYWGLGCAEDEAHILVTELMSNAVAHARRANVRVSVTRLDVLAVRIAVTDMSRTLPRIREVDGEAESGRGLAIIDALTRGRWGADPLPWGKCVWAEINTRKAQM
ncbi:ATP-binding protein [Streptomyces sp. NBC_00184]|uniref:ATP-binding protein n=1 Tax=Streptomyces sp. NBC_00184 TaxID=2975673 RepID=UPI002E2C2B86|nr:ATP-binding protein [Streptomyces sp. NBC_00184]